MMLATSGGRYAENMQNEVIKIRKAKAADLTGINNVIDAAINTWNLSDRVKRLSLPSYHYSLQDLDAMELMVAENSQQQITGLAAWDRADPKDTPPGKNILLLHGIYVDPPHQREGIGSQLLAAAEQAAHAKGYDGLLVKAQTSAQGFFKAQGMEPLKVENEGRDYTHRYWKLIKER